MWTIPESRIGYKFYIEVNEEYAHNKYREGIWGHDSTTTPRQAGRMPATAEMRALLGRLEALG